MSNVRHKFNNAIGYLLQEGGLAYTQAIDRLRGILRANNDEFELKIRNVDLMANSTDIREELVRAAREASYETESAIGTYQCHEQGLRDKLKITNILVRVLDFSPVQAIRIYAKISVSAEASFQLQDFATNNMRSIIESIISLVQTEGISADTAHKQILSEMKNDSSDEYFLAENLLSDAMKDAIDANSSNKNASEIILSRLDKGIAESKIQYVNRISRCEASEYYYDYKLEALNDIEVMQILSLEQNPGEGEKLEALKASIAIDEAACGSFGYATRYLQGAFRSAAAIPRHLGFFAQNYNLTANAADAMEELAVYDARPGRPPRQTGIFESTFNFMLQTLNHGPSQQFISMAAMALALPVANRTLGAVTGAEMMEYTPRLGR